MRTLPILGGLKGPPSACSSAPDRLDVFAAGPGNMVWRWWLDAGSRGALLGPAPLPLPNNIPAEGLCAVSSGPGRVEVFAAGAGINTPLWWRGDAGSWRAEAPLPPGANLHPVPVAAVASGPHSIDVFAAGAGNAPWWWRWNGATWTAPMPLPPGGANIVPERIAAVSARPGRFDVFAAGAHNHLWHWWLEGGSGWNLEDLGGNLPREGVNALCWGPGRIDVFAASQAAGSPLQHWWWNGAGPFGGPEDMGGNLASGAVGAVSSGPGRLEVFAVSTDRRLARWQWDGSYWSGPNYRGDNVPAGDVSAVVRAPNHVDVFVRGADNSLRQWPGGGLAEATTEPWANFARNRRLDPLAGHCRPDSLEELVAVVQEAERLGRNVRAVGSGWSNSDVAMTPTSPPGYLVETNRLDGVVTTVLNASPSILSVTGRRLVHVEAGITLSDLIILLDRRDLALPTLGGSSGQTLAGALSTSVHGSDIDRGPLPDMVRAIHLVGPGGIQHWVEPSSGITDGFALSKALGLDPANVHYDDDWFNSVLVSVGSLGIIYSVIIEVVPQHDLVETVAHLAWPAMRARLASRFRNSPFAGNRAVNVLVNPFTLSDGTRPCFLVTRREAPKTVPYSGGGIPAWLLALMGVTLKDQFEANPALIDDVVTPMTLAAFPVGVKRGWAHTITTSPGTPPVRGLALEIAFDATNDAYLGFVDAACEILHTAYRDEGLGLAGWFSLRYVGQSRAFLSPQNRWTRTCMVEFAALADLSHTPKLLARLEAAGRAHGGIQHWGMFDDLNATDVAKAYPRLDTWRRVRWELTKGGTVRTFDSDFTRRCGLSQPPSAGDYDGDGRTDFAVWRPTDGGWYVINSATGAVRVQQWGQAGDIPVPGDYDGEGKSDFAVWRPSDGTWYVINSWAGAIRTQQWGQAGDVPVPGRYDSDSRTDFAVWRPSDGNWHIISSSTGAARAQQWGQAGDVPVPGDYDNDGRTDLAVWRPSNGTWYVIKSATGATRAQQWGQAGDIPVPGRYDSDRRTDFAVWRPGNGTWYILNSDTGATRTQQWGQAGDIPVPGDYDNDGRTDLAVWRPSDGNWYIISSSTGAARVQQWGRPDDLPVVRARS